MLPLISLKKKIRVPSQQNVGPPAGHVRGDRYRAFSASLGDDFRFFFVVLRVENGMRDPLLFQKPGKTLEIVPTRAGVPIR
jgi:hypothetical protein